MTIDDAIKWLEVFERSYRNTAVTNVRGVEDGQIDPGYEDLSKRYTRVIGWLKELKAQRGGWSLAQMQEEQRPWVKHNFGESPPHHPLLGIVEEVGELSHGYLKSEQGIRGSKAKHHEEMEDAVGDIVIYLTDFCSRVGINLQDTVRKTWDSVKERDWKKNPEDGTPTKKKVKKKPKKKTVSKKPKKKAVKKMAKRKPVKKR